MSHNVDACAKLYVRMRDALAERKKEYETWEREHKEKMRRVEGELLNALNAAGAESIKTAHGTVYKSISIKPSVRDFDALSKWILATGNVGILQKRVSSTALRELGDDVVVDGVEVLREVDVNVRRS